MPGADPREIATDVYWLPLPGSNVYFVRSASSWVLIDAGWAGTSRPIRQAAETLFGADSRPHAILLTHDHPDHVGAAAELARVWDCPVYLHPVEVQLATVEDQIPVERFADLKDSRLIRTLVRAIPRRRYEDILERSSLREVARALDPDGSVPGLPDWRWIHTPGHTPGHVAYFRPHDRVLISGDALVTPGWSSPRAWARLILRRDSPRAALPLQATSWKPHLTETTARKLAHLEPHVLATGHGTPLTGPDTPTDLQALARDVATNDNGTTIPTLTRLALICLAALAAIAALRRGIALASRE